MSSRSADDRSPTDAFDVLAEPRRRHLLAVLSRDDDPASDPIPIDALATEITSAACGQPIVTDDQCSRTRISLVHVDLPRLEDAGVVTCDGSGAATCVSTTDHPLFEAEWIRPLLETPRDGGLGDVDRLNRTLEALESSRRRTACRVLARRRGPLCVADLAALIAAREGDDRLVDVSPAACANVEIELVHSHLPALAAAGLVEYDRDDGAVEIAVDAPQWRTDWIAASPLAEIPELLEVAPESSRPSRPSRTDESRCDGGEPEPELEPAAATAATRTGACRTIEGAERILERGRELADEAADELFVTITDDGGLRQRCLEHWREASDRGVDVYVGSRSPQVRDLVRAAVPDATVCEPQFDWLNFPIEDLHHGRIVFADRERVMLVTIADDPARDRLRATAVTGDGPENALVSLVREHVGPRLDRLDRLESNRDDREPTDETGTPSPLPM